MGSRLAVTTVRAMRRERWPSMTGLDNAVDDDDDVDVNVLGWLIE